MSQDLEELPLFPLNTVLFPYAQVQLHVFEDRYRQMVRDCLEFDNPFGIVLIRAGREVGGQADPYMVGTAVRILSVQTLEDGAMDIHIQGERRFRIRKLDSTKPYLIGKVEPVVELELDESPRTDALLMRARESFKELVEGLVARQDFDVQVHFPPDPVMLSFVIANVLQMENIQKQHLLEITDTNERFSALMPILERQAQAVQKTTYYRLGSAELTEWINPN
jgi:Lon protease-like protein